MNRNNPPLVIDAARVIAYAFVDDIPYRQWGSLYVAGERVEQVPCLAICSNLGADMGALLCHCDADWHVLGVMLGASVEAGKARAEDNYPGVASRWVDRETSVEAALDYYDAQPERTRCSFCGKRRFEFMGSYVEGDTALICGECISAFHRELNKES
ncbi:hypothetical protein SAMN05428948_4242 [Massilia sp. CF038]|nr:hypothetical protein SAMN05428948_4242 [Massilia sp. CF038]